MFTTLLFWYISATGNHALFTHNNLDKIDSDGNIHLLLIHIIIHTLLYYHKENPWMLHPFICFTSIDTPEMDITMSHERSLVEFNKTLGYKIHCINNLSLSNYQSSAKYYNKYSFIHISSSYFVFPPPL